MSNDTGVVTIHGKEYKTVALRVGEFREKHPISDGWGIRTEIAYQDDKRVVLKASIHNANGEAVATGHAEEVRGSNAINKTSAVENCETSAIGRALAAAGFVGTEFASADEVANAISQREQSHGSRQQQQKPPKQQPPSNDGEKARYWQWCQGKGIGEKDAGGAWNACEKPTYDDLTAFWTWVIDNDAIKDQAVIFLKEEGGDVTKTVDRLTGLLEAGSLI